VKFEEDRSGDHYTRKVAEWKLIMEYSTVYGWGANQDTPLLDIKEMKDLEIMMREGNYSDEKAKLIEDMYNKLKHLLDSDSTPDSEEPDSETLDPDAENIKRFYSLIKI